MHYREILFDTTDHVGIVTFNRPDRLNAINRRLLEEVHDVFDRIPSSGVRALIFTGAGRAFCSGADLSPDAWDGVSIAAADTDAGLILETHLNPLVERWSALSVPVVTAINGGAAGAGCSLALLGDIAIAATEAYFLQAFAKIGLVPDVGSTWLLPRLVGTARARAMMLLADRIDAVTAKEWGMIYDTVGQEQLMPRAWEIARRLAAGPTVALGLIRQGIRQSLEVTLSESIAIERQHQRVAGLTHDYAEGVAAFNEKRLPRFQGR